MAAHHQDFSAYIVKSFRIAFPPFKKENSEILPTYESLYLLSWLTC